jgi:hypothetical protein
MVAALAGAARADMYGFTGITSNSVVDPAIGEAQLRLDVTDPGAGSVRFTFLNLGPAASSITDVYFDDPGNFLSTMTGIVGSSGVSFAQGASPPDLPNGASVGFSADFSADSDSPAQPNGVNPGESLQITFSLESGISYGDVIGGLNDSVLRVGIHVQGFADGQSEAFVNDTHPMPAPGAALLALPGLAMVAYLRRRQLPTRPMS